ncbi:MAG: hypothetical protein PHS49_07415 [Candidatus Gracilibacteria bacterium]|nr:hypothetical protein [Candidatus Gracilibacteria bacterium]
MSNPNKMGDNVKAIALAASIALSPESLASKGSVHDQLELVKADVNHTLEISKLHDESGYNSLKNELSTNPLALSNAQGEKYADSGQNLSDASNAKVYPANFIEDYKTTQIPSNAKIANVGNSQLAVWKDNKGNLNVTVTKEDSTGGTDDFSFTTDLDGETYYFYTTDDMQLVAEKKSGPSSTSSRGGGIDSSNNLATINSQIDQINAKIKSIEEKPNFGADDKDFDEVDSLNKELILLKDEAIKAEDRITETAIKAIQDERATIIKAKQEIVKNQEQIIKKGLEDLQTRFK